LQAYAEKLSKQLLDLVAKVRENIPKMLRIKVNTLLIVDVHARDIVDSFVRDSILDAREFAWESQLRFYWDREPDDVVIRQCTGSFRYGYEYMGLNGRLVITPLTDRCYMTLSQALTVSGTCRSAATLPHRPLRPPLLCVRAVQPRRLACRACWHGKD
jgi:dynein heavy chain, axonemal